MMQRLASILVLVGLVSADFWVAPSGVDDGEGSQSNPFATLERAQLAVRQANVDLSKDLYVFVAPGTYYLDEQLTFTAKDSGSNGHRVIWQAATEDGGVNISGGIPITEWNEHDTVNGIWSASTPIELESRHLYVDQVHAQRARRTLDRSWLAPVSGGYQIVNQSAEFLLTTDGVEHGEVRGINSFTDRIVPVDAVIANSTLKMAQPAFDNNIIGYDTITEPFFDNGFFIENVLEFLDEANEYYLNHTIGKLFYKPPTGTQPASAYVVLAKLERLLVLSGTYDDPVHDITFQGFNYMHTTWNYPSTDVGYADQQTGGFIGLNVTYPAFEGSRPFWWQVPGSVQASAAHDITFTNGSMIAIMGGFGIGNDYTAHDSGIGLGTRNVEISGMYFNQVGATAIAVGGIQADAHHPSDERMINGDNVVTENIIYDTGKTITSVAGILTTYNSGIRITRNELSTLPYSAICYGYGWGSNDAGGSKEYANRGLYNFQPIYDTPTTLRDGLIAQNLIHDFGQRHDDLAGIYTLSASPNTYITENYIYTGDAGYGAAFYHDEGSRDYVVSNSVCDVVGNFRYGLTGWFQANEAPTYTTGNLTAFDIAVPNTSPTQVGTNQYNDSMRDVVQYGTLADLSIEKQRVVYEAGVPPSQRSERGEAERREG